MRHTYKKLKKMEIQIGENYKIKAGMDAVVLYFERETTKPNIKTGKLQKTTWQTYHATLGQALAYLLNNELLEAKDLKEVVEIIERTEKMLLDRFKFTTNDLKTLGRQSHIQGLTVAQKRA
jgi:hypothetical protein